MTPHEKTQLIEAWQGMAGLYDKKVNDATLKLVVRYLDRYELSDVMRALELHGLDPENGRFMPKPADIARHIEGDGESVGLQAWTKAIKAADRFGADKSVCFDDPLTMKVIDDMGGWIWLCETKTEEHKFHQAEFNRRYKGYRARSPAEYPSKLIGRIEAHNAAQWPDRVPPVMLIGDPERAAIVHEGGGLAGGAALQITSVQDLPNLLEMLPDSVKQDGEAA